MLLKLQMASAEERRALGPLRAGAWAGSLTEAQFTGRNDVLYRHPFGRNRVETYVLKNESGYICASMDVLQIRLLTTEGEQAAGLIASVVTAPQDRKNGYATTMLKHFFEENPNFSGVLFSDIGPPFYERFGFTAKLMRSVELSAERGPVGEPVSFAKGNERLLEIRRELVKKAKGPAATVLPEPSFIDWHVERFRHFAACANRPLPDTHFFQAHGHLLLAVPHYLLDRLDVLWMDSACAECRRTATSLAFAHGVSKAVFWDPDLPAASGKTECPMIRLSMTSPEAGFIDPQLCDWW